jgi:hypothetical protein
MGLGSGSSLCVDLPSVETVPPDDKACSADACEPMSCSPTSPASPSRSWLRTTPTGLRIHKGSRSVFSKGSQSMLTTIGEEAASGQAPGARAVAVSCFSGGTFGRRSATAPACMAAPDDPRGCYPGPYSPVSPARPPLRVPVVSSRPGTTPRQTTQTLPADVDGDSDGDNSDGDGVGVFGFRAVPLGGPRPTADTEPPLASPTSSRHTAGTDESHVQIATARPFRIHTAKARSHSIDQIKGLQLLSPESPSHAFSHRPPPLHPSRAPPTPELSPRPFRELGNPGTPQSLALLRSVSPLVVCASPSSSGPSSAQSSTSSASPSTPSSASVPRRRIPTAIVKDIGALLEQIHEDESESHCSAGSSGSGLRSASLLRKSA